MSESLLWLLPATRAGSGSGGQLARKPRSDYTDARV